MASVYPCPRAFFAALIALSAACAGQQQRPTLISSSGSVAYAQSYPEQVGAAADSFAEHRQHAHELTSGFSAHTPTPKAGDDASLMARIVDEADADGRRDSFVRARQSDRAFRSFWDEERGALTARTASAVQKQQTDAGNCADFDAQPAIQRSLREGFDRQLEKRLRAESEAQRLLEQYKSHFTPGTWQALQRLAAEISLDSYLVYIAMVDDTTALTRLRDEHDNVDATLARALEEERALQARGGKGSDLLASQERVKRIEKSRSALHESRIRADGALQDYEQQLTAARDEYERALRSTQAALVPAKITAAR